ncbi:hypothetical protein [Loktanella sp. S4079]|uniref:hypothetical protein n=1 Tax=Loktanella sp. S4079 TaxID=579483 RepID=UPI0005FA95C3|nr:hypothetical protein [Loktanella sp. S4079]KJZ20879.1 hypothetical protein TW80_09145 [Loktanella sp. S4079]
MTKKGGNPRPAKGTSLMDRLAPILAVADELGHRNQDIDRKALSDWICCDNEPLTADTEAVSDT